MHMGPDYYRLIFGSKAKLTFGPQELSQLGEMLAILIEPKKRFNSGTWCEISNITI